MNELGVPYLLLGLGVVLGLFAGKLPPSATAALVLTAVPPAGLGLGAAFC